MTLREQILEAARTLAHEKPPDQISLTDVAQAAGVHWTTVRRHIGSKADLRALLAREQIQTDQPNPDTRTRVLAAAARVFAQHGYQGASLDQVAADAGLTKGAVYWHFASKSDLFLALMQENVSKQLAAMPAEAETVLRAGEPEAAVSVWLASQLGACQADANQVSLFFEFVSSSRDPAVRAALSAITRSSVTGAAEEMRRLQESGVVTDAVDPHLLATFLQALLNGLTMAWLIDPQQVRASDWAPQLARLLWRGLAPHPDA